MSRDSIFFEIAAERAAQDAQWGGPGHDDEHGPEDWIALIGAHADAALPGLRRGKPFRQQMIRVAALAVAAIESLDRAVARAAHDGAPAPDWRPAAGIPRRACLDKLTPAELAIVAAVNAVEALPADVRLTDAVVLLGQAREKVADYVDGISATAPSAPGGGDASKED